jgi:hypothetical protein
MNRLKRTSLAALGRVYGRRASAETRAGRETEAAIKAGLRVSRAGMATLEAVTSGRMGMDL